MAFQHIPFIWINLLVWVGRSSQALSATTNFSTWFNVTEYPLEQPSNLSRYLWEAQRVAGDDLYIHFRHRCINNQVYPVLSDYAQAPGFIVPARPFDSFFFVGSSYVSSWAVDTGDGLILIDALDNPDEVKGVLLPGLAHFGYNGTDIKALIITHEHADHYGGARYIQDTFGSTLYATQPAWTTMANDPLGPEGLDPPIEDQVLTDGQQLTLGNTTISFVTTPGHTPGTVSLFLPVYDRGAHHVAGLYGGGGLPSTAAAKADQILSFDKFAEQALVQKADVLLANHQTQDNSIYNFEMLRNRQSGGYNTDESNPFVVGNDAYVRYLKTMGLCVRVKAARDGQNLRV